MTDIEQDDMEHFKRVIIGSEKVALLVMIDARIPLEEQKVSTKVKIAGNWEEKDVLCLALYAIDSIADSRGLDLDAHIENFKPPAACPNTVMN
jgi:hypothetical protein